MSKRLKKIAMSLEDSIPHTEWNNIYIQGVQVIAKNQPDFFSTISLKDKVILSYYIYFLKQELPLEKADENIKKFYVFSTFRFDEDDFAVVNCDDCDGSGYNDCGECDSRGTAECDTCDGDGSVQCSECGGTGAVEGDDEEEGDIECPTCDGDGTETCSDCAGEGRTECRECDGSGSISCENCNGDGSVESSDLNVYTRTYVCLDEQEKDTIFQSYEMNDKLHMDLEGFSRHQCLDIYNNVDPNEMRRWVEPDEYYVYNFAEFSNVDLQEFIKQRIPIYYRL